MALCCARGFSHPKLSLFVQMVSCSVTAPQTMHGLSDSEAEWHYRGLVGTPAKPWWARHSSGTAGQLRPPYSRASVQARPNLPIHFGQEPPINPISGKKHRLTSDPDHPMVRNSVVFRPVYLPITIDKNFADDVICKKRCIGLPGI